MVPMLVLDITIPIITFQGARSQGASETTAYLLAGVGPLTGIAGHVARTRRVDVVSAVFLGMYLVSAALAAVPGAVGKLLLLKDCAISAGLGLLCLGTLAPPAPKPLMFYFGRRFGGDGSDADRQLWEDRWATLPRFRAMVRRLTVLWGGGFLAEAVIKVVVAETVGFETAYVVNQVVPLVLIVGLVLATVTHVRRVGEEGEWRRAREGGVSGAPAGSR
ncbi:VC0807 family protein [Arsenicicoccus dermatophilus]|uniref:VC0807 family protein n=1 Tax=Arsenicicoccus dermatophilus TaxID=1076331 RepID=UPI001F4D2A51|nr:VC0807 family protein [Arsenicicoccus dermatophilus]MCH8613705.1 hypothetical protein [Arsenicicoccus dermatophilus]